MFKYFRYLAFSVSLVWAEPMEPLDNYNVILVHGAADMRSGLDCKNGGEGELFLKLKSFFYKKGTPLFKTPFCHAQLATRKNTLKNEASLMSVSRTSALQFIFIDAFFATSCDVAFNTNNHLFSMPYIPYSKIEIRRRYEKYINV